MYHIISRSAGDWHNRPVPHEGSSGLDPGVSVGSSLPPADAAPLAPGARRLHGHHRRPSPGRRFTSRFALPITVVAIATLFPTGLFLLRAGVEGDTVVVDQRPGAIAPGPVEGAVPGGAISVRVPPGGVALPPGAASATIQLRLSSFSRSRILVVRGPRGPFDLRPVRPQDGAYFDLGPLPASGTTATYFVYALSSADRWGVAPAEVTPTDLVAVDRGGITLDYRITARVPVGPLEALARLTFFLRHSLVASGCLLLGLCSLVLALRWWLDHRAARACGALIAGMAMLFVSLTPPFCAADEIGHMGTMEYVLAGATEARALYWPGSMSLATFVLEQDRVRWRPEQPLPLLSAAQRRDVARALAPNYRDEAGLSAIAFAFTTQTTDEAPLFYPLAASLPRRLLDLPLVERMFAYRVIIVSLALALLGAGITGLRVARCGPELFAGVVVVLLIPEWIGIASSTTPYALGLGAAALASCLVVASFSMRRVEAVFWLAAAGLAAAAGALAVRECVLLAALAVTAAVWRVSRPADDASPRMKMIVRLGSAVAIAAVPAATLLGFSFLERHLPANLRQVEAMLLGSSFLADTLPRWAPVILAPLLAALALALAERRARRARRGARWLTLGIPVVVAVLLLAAHLYFPDARVPTSQYVAGMTPELFVRRVVKAFALTAFTWDQDFIAWKSFFGALGWHDMLLPPALYALGRWVCVGVFLLIPALFVQAARADAQRARRMLALAAAGSTIFLLALVARSTMSVLHGRFLLFAGPLMGIPLAAMAFRPRARGALTFLAASIVVLDCVVIFYLIPCRYYLAGAGEVMALVP